jgi:acetyltransferase-like isoleucine patch superfamily enzyme
MGKIAKNTIGMVFRVFYPRFRNNDYHTLYYLRMAFMQKILGFNRSVPWPVHFTSQIKAHRNIQPGTKAPGSAMGCYIDGRNGIIIGENVWIGPRVSIISMNHTNCDYHQYHKTQPVKIGRDCLLATNCIILPAVELGEHTIVAAGAVVTKSFPEGNQLLAGNPARVVKKLEHYCKNEG